MNIDELVLTGHNIEITPALQEIVHKKINRLLKHYGHLITDIEIMLKIDSHHRNIAEININVQGKQLHASANHHDMYKSIDDMIIKTKSQLEKYKALHFGHQKEQRL